MKRVLHEPHAEQDVLARKDLVCDQGMFSAMRCIPRLWQASAPFCLPGDGDHLIRPLSWAAKETWGCCG
jgi:hypothetical protein